MEFAGICFGPTPHTPPPPIFFLMVRKVVQVEITGNTYRSTTNPNVLSIFAIYLLFAIYKFIYGTFYVENWTQFQL